MKRSIRRQLLVTFVGTMVITLLAIALINHLFLGRFYESRKVKEIEKAYKTINSLDSLAEEDFNNAIMEIAIQDNLQILITDEDFTTVRSTSRDAKELAARLFGYYTGFYSDKITVVEPADFYTIQKTKDISINTSYLEMWGQLDNGKWFLIRTPIESIENAVNLSNYFYLCIGALVTSIAVISIIMLSKRITNPIVQLSGLSKRMAELDFDARYTGHAGNEIDQLGENFNKMSDTLEETISELKTANVELQKDVELKNQIDEVRKEFLNNVSHELKTPIALISGYAEGLKDNIADDAESREFYCDVIIDEANKMNTMVKKLLTLNQLEFGNDQTVMERFDLTALINGVISGMRLLISEKGATVSFKVSEPVYVWGDEFKIEEVVTNYMSNALNHLDYDRQIDVRIRTENGIVTTSVFNTGDPIPEEDIDKIWDKFYKVDKARTREYGGSGIGLSIVKAIMDAHQQTCGVKNYANGVAFYFTLEGK